MIFVFLRGVFQANGSRLNGDSTLLLNIHLVKKLSSHITFINTLGELQNPVCKSGFPVVYMCNNAEISYVVNFQIKQFLRYFI